MGSLDTSSVKIPGLSGVLGLWSSDTLTWVTQPESIRSRLESKQRSTPWFPSLLIHSYLEALSAALMFLASMQPSGTKFAV